jgi:hypothetical protein
MSQPEEHDHERLVHSHLHYHVTHNHSHQSGGFEHLSSSHEHEHDHAALSHWHTPHENFEQEHRGEAHVHDHEVPAKSSPWNLAGNGAADQSRPGTKGNGERANKRSRTSTSEANGDETTTRRARTGARSGGGA